MSSGADVGTTLRARKRSLSYSSAWIRDRSWSRYMVSSATLDLFEAEEGGRVEDMMGVGRPCASFTSALEIMKESGVPSREEYSFIETERDDIGEEGGGIAIALGIRARGVAIRPLLGVREGMPTPMAGIFPGFGVEKGDPGVRFGEEMALEL